MEFFSITASAALLAVVSSMLHSEIKETGTEGNIGVIQCVYTEGYEDYVKYFCKGGYSDCKTLIKTKMKDSWTYDGRISLNDNKEQKTFIVTITDLRMEDAGRYGCGIEKVGQDLFTLVSLTVIKAPRPPKTHQPITSSPTTTSHKPQVSQHVSTSSSHESPTNATVTNKTGSSTEETGNINRSPAAPFGLEKTVGGVAGGVLLTVAVLTGIYFALRCSQGKKVAATSQPNSEDVHLYEEVQTTDPVNGSCQCSAPHLGQTSAGNQSSIPCPACSFIYSLATYSSQDRHLDNTSINKSVPITDYASPPRMDKHSSSEKINYSTVHFKKKKALNSSLDVTVQEEAPTYSIITAPQTSDRTLVYLNAGFPTR